MNASDILSLQEFDSFMARLKATVERAGEADAMEKAIARVVGTEAPSGAPAARATTPAKPGKRGPGRPRGSGRRPVDAAAILRELGRTKEGLSSTQLAELLGEKSRPRMLAALDKLRGEGQVKLVGERRNARWHAA